MANWCSNRVTFTGDGKALQQVQELFLAMQHNEETTGNGQLPDFVDTENRYFFSLYRHEGDFGIFEYETRWSPNTEVVMAIADRYGVAVRHQYEETGNCIYGETGYANGISIETDLDWEDFDRYEYNQEEGLYHFEGEAYESDCEILEILLERKVLQTEKP
ncbi:hypothetical protein GR160_06175 [Flavobacterium sp. Sd200]|uniref:DUF1281 family ferredoxin-like fold protein n=1 Tax=Flavobacterium sp. Sd200 TaxID=2692211 RepID=UPI00136EA994|nr:hypothetical protein [Flavobacterium sp. Sd200]MXN90808.1 hypothetical protein [Flavobacterium sp. Sd200]